MEPIHTLAALVSAVLHAGWNAAVRSRPHPGAAMTAHLMLIAAMSLPLLAVTGFPKTEALPWIAISTVLASGTLIGLVNGYKHAPFGIVFPMTRVVAVTIAAPATAYFLGEVLSRNAMIGIGLISASLILIAASNWRSEPIALKAWFWIFTAGIASAGSAVVEAHAVRLIGSPLAFAAIALPANVVVLCWLQRKSDVTGAAIRAELFGALPIALASIAAYVLILWVIGHAPVAPSIALRDTSAVFAIAIAVLLFKEKISAKRIAATLTAALAIPFLRLA